MSEAPNLPERRKWYQLRISAIALIPALLALLILLAPALLSGSDSDWSAYTYGTVAGMWGLRVLMALLIAWLVALPMRGSRVATTITFSLLVVLCPVGYTVPWRGDLGLQPPSGLSSELSQIRSREDDRMDQLRGDFEDDGEIDLESSISLMDESASDLERSAGTKTDTPSRILRANATVLREIQRAQTEYTLVLNRLMNEGGFDVQPGETPIQSLEDRIGYAQGVVDANTEMIGLFGKLRDRYKTAYRAEGLRPSEVNAASLAAVKATNVPAVLAIRRADTAVFRSGKVMLEVLRDAHGQWTATNDQIIFDEAAPDELMDRYNDAFDQMQFQARELLRLQSELFGAEPPDDVLPEQKP